MIYLMREVFLWMRRRHQKNEALDMVIELMIKSGKIRDKEAYKKQVYLREEESTTGIRRGHCNSPREMQRCKKAGTCGDGCQRRCRIPLRWTVSRST